MNSKNQIFHFESFSREDLGQRYSKRRGELKLGDQVVSLEKAKYVLLGIEECIGPLANKGRGGAENGFEPFLNKFLNMQSNETLVGDDICVVGKITTNFNDASPEKYFEIVEELDEFVFEVLSRLIVANQIPIVIGGGHNNAYPMMKFGNSINSSKINVLNLDAHADYRPLEGRHSGNPFSYAFRDGYIERYTVLGLHQRYNSQRIIDDLKKDNHDFSFFEDYIDDKRDLKSDINRFVESNSINKVGIELDLDSIEKTPSSAYSPSGISVDMARLYIRKVAKLNKVVYVHLPEGAPLNENEKLIVGKTLAYLVTDFISCHGGSKL
jgi:formiminoglutamase